MTESSAILFVISAAVTAAMLALARKAAIKAGFVDNPGGRKKHDNPVPLVGGLVIFPVFMILTAWHGVHWSEYSAYFAALVLLLAIGGLDDWRDMPAYLKFIIQFVAAFLIVVPGGAEIIMMGDLFGFGRFGLNFMSVPFSIIATVLLINAINLMDGLDGLSAGKGFVILSWLAAAAFVAGQVDFLAPLLILMGALAAFLAYNMRSPFRKRASIFIGDSGSLALGLSLAWFAINMAKGFDPVIKPITVAWLLALPIWDTCGQFARRVSQGRHPFDADHDHFHHHFIYAGFPVGQATAIIVGISVLTGLIGIGGIWLGLPEAVLTYPWIALLLAHIYMSMRPHRFRRIVSKLRAGKADA